MYIKYIILIQINNYRTEIIIFFIVYYNYKINNRSTALKNMLGRSAKRLRNAV